MSGGGKGVVIDGILLALADSNAMHTVGLTDAPGTPAMYVYLDRAVAQTTGARARRTTSSGLARLHLAAACGEEIAATRPREYPGGGAARSSTGASASSRSTADSGMF
jgi:hypothetical protein